MSYVIEKYVPFVYPRVVDKWKELSTWKDVVKEVFSNNEWFCGDGFTVRKNGDKIGTDSDFVRCPHYEQPSKITLKEFKETNAFYEGTW